MTSPFDVAASRRSRCQMGAFPAGRIAHACPASATRWDDRQSAGLTVPVAERPRDGYRGGRRPNMRNARYSIGGLMVAIVFVSVCLAALRNPTIVWASALFTLTVALLCTAVLAAMAAHGHARLTRAGLAVFGWAYLGIAFGPGSSGNGVTPPPFVTQALSDYLHDPDYSKWPVYLNREPRGE